MANHDNVPADSDAPAAEAGKTRRTGVWKRALWALGALLVLGVVGALAFGVWFLSRLDDSLPQLEGTVELDDLEAPVRLERDALGVATVRAGNRLDVARGLGFLHAQERFFQMDLVLRRRAAGEMSALIGPAGLSWDRAVRVHRFRERARGILRGLPARQRALIEAYTAGVNAGLTGLRARPFEYLLLRQDPEPWRGEDTVLAVLTQFAELQRFNREYEAALDFLYDTLPVEVVDFLAPIGTQWDAPMLGEAGFTPPPIPPPSVLDLRAGKTGDPPTAGENTGSGLPAGSNAFALADAHTAGTGALLANDLHLRMQAPNIWYRASFVWPAAGDSGAEHRVTGITLPGTPAMVVGSNGHVAWGLTSSLFDASDLIVLDLDPADPGRYLTPEGPRPFERREETLEVARGDGETIEILETIWGPVIGTDHAGRQLVQRWVAHEETAVDLGIVDLETAVSVDEALDVAARSGAPAQNFMAVDDAGRIGWTILGRLPRRVGCDGRLPGSWIDGACRWDGLLPVEEVPRIVDPESGRLWSANNRPVDGEMLARLGDGGYRFGARAGQIRDALFDLEAATPRDLQAIQLDNRALYYENWRRLVLDVLTPETLEDHPGRQELRRLVAEWDGRAGIDAVGYRLLRGFWIQLTTQVFAPLVAPANEKDPEFVYQDEVDHSDGPLWRLLTERPPHLLNPEHASWDEQLLAAIDGLLAYYAQAGDGVPLAQRTWRQVNVTEARHPLSAGLPFGGRWLNLPSAPMPGDLRMPLVQQRDYGVTVRLVVSPGREEEGLITMPGGQSGHPMSPHYADAHEAWMAGESTPFLPGPTKNTLILQPARAAE